MTSKLIEREFDIRGQRIFPVDEGENFMGTKFLCKFALL